MDRTLEVRVFCYPRSGSQFVRQTVNMSFDNLWSKYNCHSSKEAERLLNNNIPVVATVRHPLDSIASWNFFRIEDYPQFTDNSHHYGLDKDIAFYLRINKYIKENINRIPVIVFENFIKDTAVIVDAISSKYGHTPVNFPSVESVKEALSQEDYDKHLPRNNSAELAKIKEQLLLEDAYKEALNLYESITNMLV